MCRGRGTGEAGEAAASPEIQRLTKVNTKFSLPEKNHIFWFFCCFTWKYTVPRPLCMCVGIINFVISILLQSTLSRKCIFVQPLLAFKVKDGLKIWTKFIEKIKIRQWQPNSELIWKLQFWSAPAEDRVGPGVFGGHYGLQTFFKPFLAKFTRPASIIASNLASGLI